MEARPAPRERAAGSRDGLLRVVSQLRAPKSPARATQKAVLLLFLSGGATVGLAQDNGERRTPVLQFGASTTLTATDNAQASSSDKQSGVAAELGLDVHAVLPYRRLKGFADYSLVGVASRTDRTNHEHQHDLRAALVGELIESHGFLDVSAFYGTQLGSVFGPQERSLAVENDNRVETANITVSPSLRWRLGDGGRVEARLTNSTTRVKDSLSGDVDSQAGSLYADGGVRPRSLTWKGQAFAAEYDPKQGRRTTEASVRGDVGWAFDGVTVLSVIGGREGNDFDSPRRVYNDLYGLGLDYRPNQRTQLYAEALHRFFGTGHTVSLSYRLPQFALIATSSRTHSTPGIGPSGTGAVEFGSAFDVLFLQLSSVEPDADRRRILVLDLLRANGIDPTQPVSPTLLTSGVLLSETQSVSATWVGGRNTIAVVLSNGSSRRLDSPANLPVGDQFRAEESIDQLGAQLIWLRRLTPSSDLSATLAWTRSEGDLTQLKSTARLAQLRWSHRIGARSTLATTLSHERFDEATVPDYSVNVVSVEYRIRF